MSAVRILGLPAVPPWQIFFVEDVTTALGSIIPLSDHGLIIRARQKTKGNDDVTVKFRPGRRSQLSNAWLATTKTTDGDLKAELKPRQRLPGHVRRPANALLERDENRHQLRDARDRHARPGTVLREHLAGGWVLDDERPRLDRRRWRRCRLRCGDEGERRENCGDPDPEDHDSGGYRRAGLT